MLAINRGEKEKFLNVRIEAPEEEILRYLEKKDHCPGQSGDVAGTEGGGGGQLPPADRAGD